ncbi:MAG: SMP-30/gluconolactonase/LRE family protein [Dehalococcoidia bacterium]
MAENLSGILDEAEPRHLVGGGPTEGPLWHSDGYLTFVRHRTSQLVRWDLSGNSSIIRENTGEGNGCTLDRQGRLIMCEAGNRRITRTESDGSITVISDQWQGKRLNRPNDIVCRTDGSIFFTDPQGTIAQDQRELGFSGLFRVTPDGQLHLATDECEYPNGLAFSPDESVLYVAISRLDERCAMETERGEVCIHRRIRAFDVAADGTLSNNRVFIDMASAEPGVPDGMKVDIAGRVYCTGSGGIWVIDPEGNRLGIIRVPEVPRNLAFGGPTLSTLYITAGDSLYRLETKTRGIAAY